MTPHCFANLKQSSRRAMSPFGSSALTSSQMTPAGWSPASRQRSATRIRHQRGQLYLLLVRRNASTLDAPTEASVCPLRTSVPPSTARNGTRWPGRVKSSATVVGSASLRAVKARSCAEMPVVVPGFAGALSSRSGSQISDGRESRGRTGAHRACSHR